MYECCCCLRVNKEPKYHHIFASFVHDALLIKFHKVGDKKYFKKECQNFNFAKSQTVLRL